MKFSKLCNKLRINLNFKYVVNGIVKNKAI